MTKKPNASSPPDSPALKKYQRKAKKQVRHEMAVRFPKLTMLLKSYGVDLVHVEYSGGGDSGEINDTGLYIKDENRNLHHLLDEHKMQVFPADGSRGHFEPIKGYVRIEVINEADREQLERDIESMCNARWAASDVSDWCNDEGGGGSMYIDVLKGTLRADHHYNEQVHHSANFSGWADASGAE